MALNIATFKTRALTALIFVAVMLAGLLINQWTFFTLFTIIHFGCWIEYQQLMGKINPAYEKISPVHKYGVMLLGWMGMCYLITDFKTIFLWVGLSVFIILFINGIIQSKRDGNWICIKYSSLGLLYISLSCALMIYLYFLSAVAHSFSSFIEQMAWPLLLIATLWVNDTMAYLVGSFIGKTPLSPISPKKTWEGTIGGIILAVIVMTIISDIIFPTLSKNQLLLHSIGFIFIAIAGTFGDLLESKIKRLAEVKDSGTLMPGHGGFLDRFDSLLIATPAIVIYLLMLLLFTSIH